MYSLIKPLLFRLDAERSHDLVMAVLAALSRSSMALRAMRAAGRRDAGPVGFMGLTTANGVGLAAGLDKDARAFPALLALGFGWVEVGTVTPRPQPGNPKPRLFRLTGDRALINRLGFNSRGLEAFLASVAARRPLDRDGVLGINIGKNAATPVESAADDYLYALERVYPWADYVAVNISSPNTRSLRELQQADRLAGLLTALAGRRERLKHRHGRYVPLAVKLAPDLEDDALAPVCELLAEAGIDGVIATNTTTARPETLTSRLKVEAGGLSGAPLEPLATHKVEALRRRLDERIPIIGVGGVEDADGVRRKLEAGACAVQCYTAFIYQGPALLHALGTRRAGQ